MTITTSPRTNSISMTRLLDCTRPELDDAPTSVPRRDSPERFPLR
jgi:hypothetical protein